MVRPAVPVRLRRAVPPRLRTPARHALRRGRRALRRGRRALRRLRAGALTGYYAAQRRLPLDPDAVVYAAYWYRGASCNPRAIAEEMARTAPSLRATWVVKRSALDRLPPGTAYVVPGTRAYYRALARSSYFVNNVNFPDHLVKRPGTVHVMTHHGTPLKRMGTDLAAPGREAEMARLVRRCARWDLSISANSFSTPIWERVYPGRYESLESGYPRNDVLVRATGADVAAARAGLGLGEGRLAVLYAPTHREYAPDLTLPLDLATLVGALEPDAVVLARLHYFHAEASAAALAELVARGRVRDVSAHPSIETLCLAADVLVTDYSSLMFDYCLLDRPIVVHAPDWEEYRARRGTYFDLREQPPGVFAGTDEALVAAFRSGAFRGAEAAQARAAFRARFGDREDGHAAERVVRRLWPDHVLPPGTSPPRREAQAAR